MNASAISARGLRLRVDRSSALPIAQSSTEFVRLSHLRRVRDCEQVAAVCYRLREESIEFLLVRTRGSGRWTFPKGSAESGLTHAQAAALEAFEEAGVHGRIEEASFARYACRKGVDRRKSTARSNEFMVQAHLCQVVRLAKPKESNRDRTWFSPKDARRRLREGRENRDGGELARIVDKAVARIWDVHSAAEGTPDQALQFQQNDALHKVQFEAVADRSLIRRAAFIPYLGRKIGELDRFAAPSADSDPRKVLQCEVLEFSAAGEKKPQALALGTRKR